jgi:hypothetical protein
MVKFAYETSNTVLGTSQIIGATEDIIFSS